MTMITTLAYFFTYATIGWMVEVIFHQITVGHFVNRGMLAGPYCPIYGFGCIALVYLLYPYSDNPLLIFLGAAIICSVVEWLGGFILDKVFHERWWDYSEMPFNLSGYICLKFSVLWGIGGLILFREVHPNLMQLVDALPRQLLWIIVLIAATAMCIDTLVTAGQILKLNRKVEHLAAVQTRMRQMSDALGQDISTETARVQQAVEQTKFTEKLNDLKRDLSRGEKRLLRAFPNVRGTRSDLQHTILRHWSKHLSNEHDDTSKRADHSA